MIKKLIVFLFISIVLSGCLPSVSKKTGKENAGEFVKGAVVEDFPNLPLYKGAKVIETYGQDKKYGGSFIVADSPEKVVNFYVKSLPAGGWQSTLAQNSGSNYVFSISNPGFSGEIIVNRAADGKQTAITISVVPR